MDIHSINWEALATFSAGVAAVLGAVYVGRKQTEIQSRQVALEDLKIKSDLFEKRFATYEATADFLTHVNTYMEDQHRAKLGEWLLKYRESQFLFNEPVYRDLTEIFEKATAYKINSLQMAANQEHYGNLGKGLVTIEMELMSWLASRLLTVHEIFKNDLTLATPIALRPEHLRNPAKRPK